MAAPSEMGVDDLLGVFILLGAAAGAAVLLALLECCWKSAALAREKDVRINIFNAFTIGIWKYRICF